MTAMHRNFEKHHDESFEKLGQLMELLNSIPETEFTVHNDTAVAYAFGVSGQASAILEQSRTAGFALQRILIDKCTSELPGYGVYIVCMIITSVRKIEFRKGYCHLASSNRGFFVKKSLGDFLFFLIEVDPKSPYSFVFDSDPNTPSTIARLFIEKSMKEETIEKN